MKVVWVLIEFEDYEGIYVKGVVDSLEKAARWVSEQIDLYKKKWNEECHKIEMLPHGYKSGSHGFIYEEWDVQ